MSRKEDYEEKVWKLLVPILDELGMKPVDVEYVKEGGDYYLRCYIDKEGGVGIDDCEEVSNRLDPKLDEADIISDAYILEVSSPGLGRPLKRPRDFEFAMGKEIEIKTYKAVDGSKEWKGILTAWDKEKVRIQPEGAEEMTFTRTEISLIRLAFDF